MADRSYTCARCKKIISRVVESCTSCLKDFHPGCTNQHKIFDQNNILIQCPGPTEIFNIRSTGKKIYKRRRTISANYEQDEIVNINDNSNNNYVNNEIIDCETASTLDNKIDVIFDKLDHIYTKNLNVLKDYIKKLIEDEMCELKSSIRATIQQELRKNSEDIKNEVVSIRKSIGISQMNNTVDPRSTISMTNKKYSSVVKQGNSSNVERISVKPINEQSNDITVAQIKNSVDVVKLGIGVQRIMNKPNGQVFIDVDKEADKVILAQEIKDKLGSTYNVTAFRKKKPKLKIVGLEKELLQIDDHTFIEDLYKINNLCDTISSKNSTKIIKKYLNKQNLGSMILEVSPEIHKVILENSRIKFGWRLYKVYDYVNIVRCFKCWGFNHFKSKCTNQETCRKCADHHKESDCKSDFDKCINCCNFNKKHKTSDLTIDHKATDICCGIYNRLVHKEKANILHHNQ